MCKVIKTRILLLFLLIAAICVQIQCYTTDYSQINAHLERSKATENTGKLIFRIEPDQKEYYPGAPIYLIFSLENVDTIPFFVNKRFMVGSPDSSPFCREVYLYLYLPTSDSLPRQRILFLREVADPTRELFVPLWPGDKIHSDKHLLNPYYEIDEVGKYKVVGVYENYWGPEFGFRNAWMGKIESEPVEFQVLPAE